MMNGQWIPPFEHAEVVLSLPASLVGVRCISGGGGLRGLLRRGEGERLFLRTATTAFALIVVQAMLGIGVVLLGSEEAKHLLATSLHVLDGLAVLAAAFVLTVQSVRAVRGGHCSRIRSGGKGVGEGSSQVCGLNPCDKAMRMGAMERVQSPVLSRRDFVELTKARLSVLVVVTAMAGYLLATRGGGFDGWTFIHMVIGTTLAAFASGVFNQILEVDSDALHAEDFESTASGAARECDLGFRDRMVPCSAGLGAPLDQGQRHGGAVDRGDLGNLHFMYTPLKRVSTWNTLVGAVSGALPPVVGWAAGGGSAASSEAVFLFVLLFLWQLPHFLAINWMYREEYERAGFVMWSNGDVSGARTARLMVLFSGILTVLTIVSCSAWICGAVVRFRRGCVGVRDDRAEPAIPRFKRREDARAVFFYTLLYLPACLLTVFAAWRS